MALLPLNWQRVPSSEDNSDDSVSLLFILSGVGPKLAPGNPYMSSKRSSERLPAARSRFPMTKTLPLRLALAPGSRR